MALEPRGYRIYCDRGLERHIILVNDTLDFEVDGIPSTVTLKAGIYETLHEPFESELPAMINEVLQADSLPVICKLGGVYDYVNNRTVLVFEHTDVNIHHDLTITGGSAFPILVGSILGSDPHEDGIFDVEHNFAGSILVVYPDLSELDSSMAVRRTVRDDSFTGSIAVSRLGESSITGRASVVSAARLEGSLIVRKSDASTLKGSLAIPTDGSLDLGSFLIVKKTP